MRMAFWLSSAVCFGASFVAAADNPPVVIVTGAQITIAHQIEVPALEVGIIGRLSVKEGDLVEDGQLLGILDDVDAKLALSRAEIEASIAAETAKSDITLRSAKNGHATAKAELARSQEAVEKFKKSVSETELDRLRLSVEQTQLQIEQSGLTMKTASLNSDLKQSELAIARRKVSRHEIRSRVTGRVIEINKQPGEWVETGKTVLKIARLDRLRCKGFVEPRDLTSDPTGQPVKITVTLGKTTQELTGKLVFVASEVSVKGDLEVWAEFDNPTRSIRPGIPATMQIMNADKLADTGLKQ